MSVLIPLVQVPCNQAAAHIANTHMAASVIWLTHDQCSMTQYVSLQILVAINVKARRCSSIADIHACKTAAFLTQCTSTCPVGSTQQCLPHSAPMHSWHQHKNQTCCTDLPMIHTLKHVYMAGIPSNGLLAPVCSVNFALEGLPCQARNMV